MVDVCQCFVYVNLAYISSLFRLCSVYVSSTFRLSSVYILSSFHLCSVYISSIFNLHKSLFVLSMFILCSANVQSLFCQWSKIVQSSYVPSLFWHGSDEFFAGLSKAWKDEGLVCCWVRCSVGIAVQTWSKSVTSLSGEAGTKLIRGA